MNAPLRKLNYISTQTEDLNADTRIVRPSTFRAMEIDSSLIADLTASAFERIGKR